jgi:CubicO group peptidase (beta-lactamase class C family)
MKPRLLELCLLAGGRRPRVRTDDDARRRSEARRMDLHDAPAHGPRPPGSQLGMCTRVHDGRVASALSRPGARTFGVALLTALSLAGCGDGSENGADPGRADPADASIERFLDRILPEAASGSLVAARDGDMVHCQGFGMADAQAERRATCDTVYDVMSMTKQFTAAAVLKLEMMGKLRVRDPITKYLDGVPRDKRKITLHQLLVHTSGLLDALGGDYQRLRRGEMLAKALGSKLLARPGARWAYSNVGYSVLAAIVEKVSGMAYEKFLARYLFGPAEMTQTGYVLPDWRPNQVAVE